MKHALESYFFCCIFCIFFTAVCDAQVYTGGTIGANYNNGYIIEVAPKIGYRYKILETGAAPFFTYYETYSVSNYAYGARLFSSVTIIKDTFVHAEIEAANVGVRKNAVDGREWVIAIPIGGGYRYKIAEGTYAYGMILYNIIEKENSHIKNPIVRAGITYNL